MKGKSSTTPKPEIKVLVTETTWKELTEIGSIPREVFIALSRVCPEQVRTLTNGKTQKLLKTVSPTEIGQIGIRKFLQESTPLTPAERASLRNPSDPATQTGLLARAVMHQHPETFRDVLRKEAEAIRKSMPFEKHPRQLLIKLTPDENESFRSFAKEAGVGPSDLGGLLIERFAREFAGAVRQQLEDQRKKHTP